MSKMIPLVATLTVLGTSGVAPGTKPTQEHEAIGLKLERIEEVRRTDFNDDSDMGFSMFETPGLELRFAIDAPPGRHIIEVQQPATLDAVDSKGTDLTALKPTNFGQPKYVDTVRQWEKPPHALTFKLALPARAAEHFSLTSRMHALTYRTLERGTLQPTPEWQVATEDLVGDKEVRFRLERKRGNVHLVFQPGTAREMIENISLEQSGTALESEGTMWNDLQVGYMFTQGPAASGSEDFTARITVRQGMKTLPLEIDIKEQPLP